MVWLQPLKQRKADCNFIDKSEAIIITGSTGIGKSYVASAIGNQACMQGYKVLYANTTKLFARLIMSKADGSYIREISRIEKQDLLILDDFGIQPFDNQSHSSLMEIIKAFAFEKIGKLLPSYTKKMTKSSPD